MTRPLILLATVLAATASGCSEPRPEPPRVVSTVPSVPADTPRATQPGDPDCPRDGVWRTCAIVDRIVRAGMVMRPTGDTTRVAFLDVPGVQYRVGRGAVLTVFLFPDSTAARRAVSGMDTVLLRARGDSVSAWNPASEFMSAQNLVAILEGGDGQLVERVRLAVSAGAPYTAPSLR